VRVERDPASAANLYLKHQGEIPGFVRILARLLARSRGPRVINARRGPGP